MINPDNVKENLNNLYTKTRTKSMDVVTDKSEWLKDACAKKIVEIKDRIQSVSLMFYTREDAKEQLTKCILIAKSKSNQILSESIGSTAYRLTDQIFKYANEYKLQAMTCLENYKNGKQQDGITRKIRSIKETVKQKLEGMNDDRLNQLKESVHSIQPINLTEKGKTIIDCSFGDDEPVRTITIENRNNCEVYERHGELNSFFSRLDNAYREQEQFTMKENVGDYVKYKLITAVESGKENLTSTLDNSLTNFNKLMSNVINDRGYSDAIQINNLTDNIKKASEDLRNKIEKAKCSSYEWGVNELTKSLSKLNNKLKETDSNESECAVKDECEKSLTETLEETKCLCKYKINCTVNKANNLFEESVTYTYALKDYACKTAEETFELAKDMYDKHGQKAWDQINDFVGKVDVRVEQIKKGTEKYMDIFKGKINETFHREEGQKKEEEGCKSKSTKSDKNE